MKKILFYSMLISVLALQSCKKKIKVNYSLSIYTQKLGENSYPDDFKSLLLPLRGDIDKKTEAIFSCISTEHTVSIERIDDNFRMPLSINTDSKLGKSMSGNKGAENRLNKAFEKLEFPDQLKNENKEPDFSKLSSYNGKIYVFSNKYEMDSIVIIGQNLKVFNQIESLRASLLSDLSKKQKEGKNIGDYAILYNVDLSSINPKVDSSLQSKDTIINVVSPPSQSIPPKPEVKPGNNGGDAYVPPQQLKQLSASSIKDLLTKLTSTEYNDKEKEYLSSGGYLQYFTTNAYVVVVDNNNTPDTYSIKEYIGHIRGRNKDIRLVSQEPQGGKCNKLTVREP